MAIRDAKFYLYEGFSTVLGHAARPEDLLTDLPLDMYDDGILLSDYAKSYQDELTGIAQRVLESPDRSFSAHTGKQVHEHRVGMWRDLTGPEAAKLYSTYVKGDEMKSMALAEPIMSAKPWVCDAAAKTLTMRVLLDSLALSEDLQTVQSAVAVSSMALDFQKDQFTCKESDVHGSLLKINDSAVPMAAAKTSLRTLDRMKRLCGVMAKPTRMPTHRCEVVRHLCRESWMEADDEEADAMLSMLMGQAGNAVIGEYDDEIAELEMEGIEESLVMRAEVWEKIEAAEASRDKVKDMIEVMSESGKRVKLVYGTTFEKMLFTREGVALECDKCWVILSLKDLGVLEELFEEYMSSLVDMSITYSKEVAKSYKRSLLQLLDGALAGGVACCNYMSAAHRDFELEARALTTGAFDMEGKFITLDDALKAVKTSSAECGAALGRYMAGAPKEVDGYHWARSARCIPLLHFSIPLLMCETKRVHELEFEPKDESVDRLSLCIRFMLGSLYKSLHGVAPRGFDEAMNEVPEDGTISDRLDAMKNWDSRGVAEFDREAACVRDKANVPSQPDVLTSADAWNNAKPEHRREILYFSTRDWRHFARGAINYLSQDSPPCWKKHDSTKPESKHTGRSISSEEAGLRKANSLVNNNLMPYVDNIEGSFMAASPAKKDRTIFDIAADCCGASRKGMVSLLLTTDFTKFGHSLPIAVQTALHCEIAEFFAEDWIKGFPKMLLKQRIVCVHGQHFGEFDNLTGGDGQGMRNAAWELMLAACVVFVHDELTASGYDYTHSRSFGLLYYMDDHLFKLLFKGSLAEDGTPLPETLEKCQRWERAIADAYRKLGFDMNPEKNSRSFQRSIIIGMKISTRGREHVPGRAIQRLLVSPSHRCPALPDMVAPVVSAATSAMDDGMPRHRAYAAMVYGSALRMTWHIPARNQSSVANYAVRLVAPLPAGGLGLPLEATLVVTAGVNRFDDFLTGLFLRSQWTGPLGGACRAMVKELRVSGKGDLPTVCRNSLIVHNTVHKSPSSEIFKAMEKHSELYRKLRMSRNMDKLKAHLDATMRYINKMYDQLPATMVEALVGCHPYSVEQSEIERIAISSTCQSLLDRAELQAARRKTRSIDMQYLSRIGKVNPVARLPHQFYDEFLAEFGQSCRSVVFDSPPRGPRKFMVLTADLLDHDLRCSKVKKNAPYGKLTFRQGKGSVSKLSALWADSKRSAVSGAVDLAVACASTRDAGPFLEAVYRLWGKNNILDLTAEGEVDSPFRDLTVVKYAPQCGSMGIRHDLQSHFAEMAEHIVARKHLDERPNCHINSGACLVAATASGPGYYYLADLAIWSEPVLVRSSDNHSRPPNLVADSRTARRLALLADRLMVTVPAIEEPRADKSLGSMLDRILHDSAQLRGHIEMRAAIPTLPTRQPTAADTFAVAWVSKLSPTAMVDGLLQILAWRVLDRVMRMESDQIGVAMDAIDVASRRLRDWPVGSVPPGLHLLLPTQYECESFFAYAEECGITEPAFATLTRIITSAAGPQKNAPYMRNASILGQTLERAHVFWLSYLQSQMGHLCSLEVPYSSGRAYSLSSARWFERHKKSYMEAALVVEKCKDAGADVSEPTPRDAATLCLVYEAKARIMEILMLCSMENRGAEEAFWQAMDALWRVYARAVAKRTLVPEDVVERDMTLMDMYDIADSITKSRMVGSAVKVLHAVEMVASDLGQEAPETRDKTTGMSLAINALQYLDIWVGGVEEGLPAARSRMSRAEAEDESVSPKVWLTKSGVAPSGMIHYVLGMKEAWQLGLRAQLGLRPKGEVRSEPRFRRLTKVRFKEGKVEHRRSRYGSETHRSIRHGSTSSRMLRKTRKSDMKFTALASGSTSLEDLIARLNARDAEHSEGVTHSNVADVPDEEVVSLIASAGSPDSDEVEEASTGTSVGGSGSGSIPGYAHFADGEEELIGADEAISVVVELSDQPAEDTPAAAPLGAVVQEDSEGAEHTGQDTAAEVVGESVTPAALGESTVPSEAATTETQPPAPKKKKKKGPSFASAGASMRTAGEGDYSEF